MDAVTLVQSIIEKAPSFESGGTTYYIVERDIPLAEEELLAYATEICAPEPTPTRATAKNPLDLVAATVDGKPMRWKLGTRLTWKVDATTFPAGTDQADRARAYAIQATSDWNDALKDVDVCFEEADENAAPLFDIVYENFPTPGLFAVAFFPKDPPEKRVVRVGPAMFAANSAFDPNGVLRHELGHVLGCRHEHIRPEAPPAREGWVVGDMGAESLTGYDTKSCMHYPLGAGFGTTDFQLTPDDKTGIVLLYSKPTSEVKEFGR